MELIEIISNRKPYLLDISWDPTNFCNFKCRYCWPEANAATHKLGDNVDSIVDNFRHLMNYYTEHCGKTKFRFCMTGGEPTLWKPLEDFIFKIKEKHDVYFTLVSNGSRTMRWWEENSHLIDNAHLTHHLAQGNISHITKVADILYSAGCKVTVKVLMDPLFWDQGIADIDYMKTNSKYKWFILACGVHEIQESDTIPKYTKEQVKYLKRDVKRIPNLLWIWKNKHLLIDHIKLYESTGILKNKKKIYANASTYFTKNLNFFKGWECSVGIDYVYINWTGDLRGACGSKLYRMNSNYNILSPTFKQEFNPIIQPVLCEFDACYCSTETHLDKKKIIPILQS